MWSREVGNRGSIKMSDGSRESERGSGKERGREKEGAREIDR